MKIIGGLGNQLFQYSYAKSLQKIGYKVKIDIGPFKNFKLHDFYLDRYFIDIDKATEEDLSIYKFTNIITKIITDNDKLGGSMRLGLKRITLYPNSKVKKIYGKELISERHRHRFAMDDGFKKYLRMNWNVSTSDDNTTEVVELKNHPWYIGTQYHPEYNSTPFNPHPLFRSFIEKCIS